MPSYTQWLEDLPLKENPAGVRLDLRLYIYPDGHGNIVYAGPDGNQPVNDLAEAIKVLSDLWERGQAAYPTAVGH